MKDPVAKKLDLGNTPKKTKKARIEDKASDASDEELKIPPRRSAGKRRRAIIESDSDNEKENAQKYQIPLKQTLTFENRLLSVTEGSRETTEKCAKEVRR